MKCSHFLVERFKNKIVCKDCREVVQVMHPLFEMDGVTPVDAVEAIQYALNGTYWATDEDINEQKHLDHEFYKAAAAYREQMRIGQIIKGSKKYPEPFNPFSWSPKELLAHAMQENVDQGHYIYGLYEWIERLKQDAEKDNDCIKKYMEAAEYWHKQAQELQAEVEEWKELNMKMGGRNNDANVKIGELIKDRDEWKHEAKLAHEEIKRIAAERDNWRMAAINNHDCHKDTQIHWGPAYNQIRAVTCNQCGKVIMGELLDKEA